MTTLLESESVQEDDKTLTVPLYRDKTPSTPTCLAHLGTWGSQLKRFGTRRIVTSRPGRDAATLRDPPVDVSMPVQRATCGVHADDEPKQRQPEHDVPECRDEYVTSPSITFRDRE
ncbi:hypothetical protein Taro_033688 [Colocasia esculenta]|uniref:Uncharacterized protein n=1 Tax=Colocasia esculenta TaxID=4460 RepID=A0A843WD76_COLES|nr:hypothetical protein [Colocasia esculenta]